MCEYNYGYQLRAWVKQLQQHQYLVTIKEEKRVIDTVLFISIMYCISTEQKKRKRERKIEKWK